MNERIKELYGKASEYACNQLGYPNQHVGKTLADVANEKFAELLIIECASVAYKSCDQGDIAAQSILYEFNIDNARQQK